MLLLLLQLSILLLFCCCVVIIVVVCKCISGYESSGRGGVSPSSFVESGRRKLVAVQVVGTPSGSAGMKGSEGTYSF